MAFMTTISKHLADVLPILLIGSFFFAACCAEGIVPHVSSIGAPEVTASGHEDLATCSQNLEECVNFLDVYARQFTDCEIAMKDLRKTQNSEGDWQIWKGLLVVYVVVTLTCIIDILRGVYWREVYHNVCRDAAAYIRSNCFVNGRDYRKSDTFDVDDLPPYSTKQDTDGPFPPNEIVDSDAPSCGRQRFYKRHGLSNTWAITGVSALVLVLFLSPCQAEIADGLSLCKRHCYELHFRLTAECVSMCEADSGITAALSRCVGDKPADASELRECVRVKAGAGKPLSATEALAKVQAWTGYLPMFDFMRDGVDFAAEYTSRGISWYKEKSQGVREAFSRSVSGTTAGDDCYVAPYPLFTTSITRLTERWTLFNNPLTQYVLFSNTAKCDDHEVVFASGRREKARGVVIIQNDAQCGWPLPNGSSTGERGAGLLTDSSCKPIGHSFWMLVGKGICVVTSKHGLDASTYVVHQPKSGSPSTVSNVLDIAWTSHGDVSYSSECSRVLDKLPFLEAGDTCTFISYAAGLGPVEHTVDISVQLGAGIIGRARPPVISGVSGSACITKEGRVGIVSAVVSGGVRLQPVQKK